MAYLTTFASAWPLSKSSHKQKAARNSQIRDSRLPAEAVPAADVAPSGAPAAAAPALPTSPPGRSGLLGKLKHVKGVIVAIAGVGAVLSGFVGWYTTYKTVAAPSAAPAAVQPAEPVKAVNAKSIAVLPFANMSGDKGQEYFSDGISEELLNQLTKVRDLQVIARTSSFSFKGKDVKVEQIARELGVANILQGSIRKSGNKVRVTAQLIHAADGSQVWSETYDRDMSDIFAMQDEIAAAVVAQLKATLLGGAAIKARVVKPEAYALVLQARELARQRSPKTLEQALALAQQALRLEPGYAEAWNMLAIVYTAQADNFLRPTSEGYALAREAVNKVLAIDPNDATAYGRLAWMAMSERDLAAAARYLNRAQALEPDGQSALSGAAALALVLGRMDDARALREALMLRDPVNPSNAHNLAVQDFRVGRYDDAIAGLRKALALSGGSRVAAHFSIGLALLLKGEPQAALAEMQLEPVENGWGLTGLPLVWHALGDKAKADAALVELIKQSEKDSAYNIAYVYAYRGEADKAFAWLDKALAYRDSGLSEILTEPLFANIRQDKRWLPFLRKLGLAPEQVASIVLDVKPAAR